MTTIVHRAALAAALLALSTSDTASAAVPGAIPFHRDIATARTAARESGRPVVVLFDAAWCPPCRELERALDEGAPALADVAEWARVDIDRSPSAANRFHVVSVPALLVLDRDGAPASRMEGRLDPARLGVRLRRLAARRPDAEADPAASFPVEVAPASIADGDTIRRPHGYRRQAACFSHVGYGPLSLGSQSPFRAIRLGLRPHTPSTLGRGEVEASGRATWSNVWATGSTYVLDYETLRLNTEIAWGITDRLELSAALEDASRFGGILDGLTQTFHDVLGLDQNGRDEVPRGAFRFELTPGDARPVVSLGPGDRGSYSRGVTATLAHSLTCGSERAPAVSYALDARVDTSTPVDVGTDRGIDLGASLAVARRVGPVYLYGTAGYSWFDRESFRGLPLEPAQASLLAAAEWAVAPRHALLLQYLLTEGVVSRFAPFSSPSHEVTLGWKWEFRDDGLLEVGIIENVFAFDNGPDIGLHVGLSRRF